MRWAAERGERREERAPTEWAGRSVIDYLLLPSVVCPLHSHHPAPLPFPFLSTLNQHPLPPYTLSPPIPTPPPLSTLVITYTLHVAHISSHYTSESEWPPLLSSVMNVSVNCARTHKPSGSSQHHSDATIALCFPVSLTPLCQLNVVKKINFFKKYAKQIMSWYC